MAVVIEARAREVTRAGAGDTLATISGVLLLLLAILVSLASLADIVGRYGAGRPLLSGDNRDLVDTYFGLGFAAAALLALPAALAVSFVRSGTPPLKSRSALALVPGCLVAFVVAVIGFIATVSMTGQTIDVGVTLAANYLMRIYANFVFLFIPVVIVASAAFGGSGTPEATAAAAAPSILVGLFGMIAEVSIANTYVALLGPMIVAAIVSALLYTAAPARAVTPWLAGWALAFGITILVMSGLFTPTEAAGTIAAFGLATIVPIRALALAQPLGPMLRQMGTETAAIVAALAAGALVALPLTMSGAAAGLADIFGGSIGFLAAAAAVFLVLAYFLTAGVAIVLAAPLVLPAATKTGLDPVYLAAITVLLGLAAVGARAGRGSEARGVALSHPAALSLAAVLVGLAVLIALVPQIALAPVNALMR